MSRDDAPRGRRRPWIPLLLAVALVGAAWVALGDDDEVAAGAAIDDDTLLDARDAIEAEDWDLALRLYARILSARPIHAEAQAGQALAERERANRDRFTALRDAVEYGRWAEALAALDAFPSDSVYSARAEALRAQVEAGWRASERDRARMLLRAGRLEDAAEVVDELRSRVDDSDELRRLGRAIEAKLQQRDDDDAQDGDGDEAPAHFAEDFVEPEPPPEPVHDPEPPPPGAPVDEVLGAGLRFMMQNNRPATLELLERAAEQAPDNHIPHQRMCALLKAMKRYDEALAACQRWLELEPNTSYRRVIEGRIEQLGELIGEP